MLDRTSIAGGRAAIAKNRGRGATAGAGADQNGKNSRATPNLCILDRATQKTGTGTDPRAAKRNRAAVSARARGFADPSTVWSTASTHKNRRKGGAAALSPTRTTTEDRRETTATAKIATGASAATSVRDIARARAKNALGLDDAPPAKINTAPTKAPIKDRAISANATKLEDAEPIAAGAHLAGASIGSSPSGASISGAPGLTASLNPALKRAARASNLRA